MKTQRQTYLAAALNQSLAVRPEHWKSLCTILLHILFTGLARLEIVYQAQWLVAWRFHDVHIVPVWADFGWINRIHLSLAPAITRFRSSINRKEEKSKNHQFLINTTTHLLTRISAIRPRY